MTYCICSRIPPFFAHILGCPGLCAVDFLFWPNLMHQKQFWMETHLQICWAHTSWHILYRNSFFHESYVPHPDIAHPIGNPPATPTMKGIPTYKSWGVCSSSVCWWPTLEFEGGKIWSNYSDLTRPHPKWWFSKGIPLISRKSRLVKYYNLARKIMRWWVHRLFHDNCLIPTVTPTVLPPPPADFRVNNGNSPISLC